MDSGGGTGGSGLVKNGRARNGEPVEGGGTNDRPKFIGEKKSGELLLLLDRRGIQTDHIVDQVLILV
jgi:hypothetical protein